MERPDLDQLRSRLNGLENHAIDELRGGGVNRRQFLQHATALGIGLPLLSYALAACGVQSSPKSKLKPKRGGRLRVGILTPTGTVNPAQVSDQGGSQLLVQTGEALTYRNPDGHLEPMLATKWSSDTTGSVWAFDLREGVRFHNGHPFTADDVVYTFNLATDPKVGSVARSALGGVLSNGNIEKINDYRVAFHLDTPVGSFPYLVSSDLYNAIIVPNGYDLAKWSSTFVGTGAFKLKEYTPKSGATFVRNDDYWGPKAMLDQLAFTFYDTESSEVVAMLGGELDAMGSMSFQGGQAVVKSSSINVLSTSTSAYREVHLRVDTGPFMDRRVRQALALTLDRPAIVSALFSDKAVVGNDSPFASIFESTNTSVPQRAKNIGQAQQLLAAAGHGRGFSAPLYVEAAGEMPAYAQFVQASAKAVGIDLQLHSEPASVYFGDATFGHSDWLDSVAGISDYEGRGVPNVYLTATLGGGGIWNAAHFADKHYDDLVKQYVAAIDLSKQRELAGKIEQVLLDETPVIISYFYDWLNPVGANVSGVRAGSLPKFNAASFG